MSSPSRLSGTAAIRVEAGKVISRYKTGKHFSLTITDTSLAIKRRQDRIGAEAALDGFYVLRTPVPASQLDGPAVVAAYKNLTRVERIYARSNPATWTCTRSAADWRNASGPTCRSACSPRYLTRHLRKAWTPLTFTDEHLWGVRSLHAL